MRLANPVRIYWSAVVSAKIKPEQTACESKVPLPPLPEQRRIVRKLDTLSARTATARTNLNAKACLNLDCRCRKGMVWRRCRKNDEIDFVDRNTGVFKRCARGPFTEIRRGFPFGSDVARADARTLHNPVVSRFHYLFKIAVRHHARWRVGAATNDCRSDHACSN